MATGLMSQPDYTAQAAKLYQDNLGRKGDAQGEAYWAEQLASGQSADQVTSNFKNSAKTVYQDYLTNPNSPNIANPQTAGLMASDLNVGVNAGTVTGKNPQSVAQTGLKSNIYENLYGDTSPQPITMPPRAAPVGTGLMAAQLGTPTPWTVTPDQTVEKRVMGLIGADSPLIQQARTGALQQMNARGLLNSSIAQGAADTAAYSAALPIAQADAATASKAAGYNADESNQFAVQNMNAQNTLSGQKLGVDANLSLANLDAQTKGYVANLDLNTKTQLAQIEAQTKGGIQSNQSSSDLFRQVTANLANISNSTEMDAAAKQRATDNQLALLKSGLAINGAIGNVNLGNLLDFSNINQPIGNTQPVGQFFTPQATNYQQNQER